MVVAVAAVKLSFVQLGGLGIVGGAGAGGGVTTGVVTTGLGVATGAGAGEGEVGAGVGFVSGSFFTSCGLFSVWASGCGVFTVPVPTLEVFICGGLRKALASRSAETAADRKIAATAALGACLLCLCKRPFGVACADSFSFKACMPICAWIFCGLAISW
jgi:hypothetical protein